MDTIASIPLTKTKGPKYRAVADAIRISVKDGQLEPGAKLPPVRELAYRLAITPGTVARAYSVLTDEGLLLAEVGRGTFVAEPPSPLQDDVWSRQPQFFEAEAGGNVSLFSPRLADVGQVEALRRASRTMAESAPQMDLA